MLKDSKNPQVIYSLNKLSKALYDLMQQHSFEEITVTQICQEAQITRRTFYRNCDNKLDLVDYMLQNQIRDLLSSVDFTCTDTTIMFEFFFQYWKLHNGLLVTLYRNNLFEHFSQVFTKCCIQWMQDSLMVGMLRGRPNQDTLRHFYNSFLIGGLCNVLESWTAEQFGTPISDLVYVLTTLAPQMK